MMLLSQETEQKKVINRSDTVSPTFPLKVTPMVHMEHRAAHANLQHERPESLLAEITTN